MELVFEELARSAPSIDFEKELNPEQYLAVTAQKGPALVLAGAGSGKTRTLTFRVAWLLSQGLKPWEILLLTFTNKAAKEMIARVEELTHVGAHNFWGGTFHHIGQRILRTHGPLVDLDKSFNILDEGDADALLSDAIRDVDPSFLKNKDNPRSKFILNLFSYQQNTLKTLEATLLDKAPELSHLKPKLERFLEKYKEKKIAQKVVDYDDLLVLLLKLLKEHEPVAKALQDKFKYILVDEYQDTNPLQSAIIDILGIHHQIMAVGDDAQCIYTWRGADIENILSFPDRHPGTVIYKIQTNYRSTPNILDLANGILEQHPKGYSKELRSIRSRGESPYSVMTMDTREQANFVIRRVQALIEQGTRPSDIAVLYRAHYQAMDLQLELSRQNLPYQITSGVRFFEQAHVKDLVAQLRFVNNPSDSTAFCRFVGLLPKVGPRTAEKLLAMLMNLSLKEGISIFKALDNPAITAKVPESARDLWVDMAYSLQDMHEALGKESPEALINIAIEGWYTDFLRTLYPNWHARIDDLESLKVFAARYTDMAELLAQLMLLSSEMSDKGALQEDCLRLSTVHQAKGLEFSVVFIIGLADNLFPLKRAIEEGNLSEELRLFYVAATRAKDALYLLSPKMGPASGPPILLQTSRFVTHLEPRLYQSLHIKPRSHY